MGTAPGAGGVGRWWRQGLCGTRPPGVQANEAAPDDPTTAAAAATPQEKRKREEGKASRGGSYVEEEKRRAREFGVVSGFD